MENIKNISKEELKSNLYISNSAVLNLLKITHLKWYDTKKSMKIKEVYKGYYRKSDIDKVYKLQKVFIENHMSVPEVREIITKSKIEKLLTKYEVPDYAYTDKFKNRTTAFKKEDVKDVILNGDAKDEYYVKNNYDLEKANVKRKNLKANNEDAFKEMSFEEFKELYYVKGEIKEILIRKFQREAKFISIPTKFRKDKFKGKLNAYKKEDILKLKKQQIEENGKLKITKLEKESGKYISFKEACETLEIHRTSWLKIRQILNIEVVRTGYTLRKDVLNLIEEYNAFLEKYCSYDEAYEIHPSPLCNKLSEIETKEIPTHLKIKCFSDGRINAYSREMLNKDIEKYIAKQEKIASYYKRPVAMSILNLSERAFEETIDEFEIESELIPDEGQSRYYKKCDIEYIKTKQQEFLAKNYIRYDEVIEFCSKSGWIDSEEIRELVIELRPWQRSKKFNGCSMAYDKDEVNSVLKAKEQYLEFIDYVDLKDILVSFRDKLEINPYFDYKNLREKYKITTEFLHNFFDEKILNSGASFNNLNRKIRLIVRFYGYIYEMLSYYNSKEIYMLKTENIMEFLLKEPKLANNQYIIVFLTYVYEYLISNIDTKVNNKIFDIEKISKKFKGKQTEKELLDADNYELEVFLEMLNHCMNVRLNTDIALKEIKEENTAIHASYWFFICINLNNAWRMDDITNIPMLDLDDLLKIFEISNLEWFEKNSLTLDKANLILKRLEYNQYIVSKTKEYNYLFISEDLAISAATSIVILILFKRNKIIDNWNELIMSFDTKYNHPTIVQLKKFFSDNSLNKTFNDEFQFRGKKTSSTLLTFISSIQYDDCSEATLELAQKLRAHKDIISLLNYIKVNSNTLNILTRNLFNRGEFGFIYSAIANKLNISTNKLKEPNAIDNVLILKEIVPSPWDFENISGLINNYSKEHRLTLNNIDKMTFIELQEKFADIVMKKCPSKIKDVECFIGYENCKDKKKDCIKCINFIPTLFALNTIAKGLLKLLLDYLASDNLGEKIKLSNSIFYYKKHMKEALDFYGKELVYSYIDISREDFLYLLSQVESIDKLIKLREYTI